MARTSKRLTVKTVDAINSPGRYGDGDGLWLQVGPTKGKAWLFRYMLHGKARTMGLGPVDLVSLAEARDKAHAARKLLLDGIDPLAQKAAVRAEQARAKASMVTFKEAAERYVKSRKEEWQNAKHAAQWESTLATYCFPVVGKIAVADIDTGLVLKCLEPIWTTKAETAGRVRQRMESILDWARVRGYRDGDNPARLKGHLDKILPNHGKVKKVEHHAALPYAEIGAFLGDLRSREATAARALEFAILTAARTGEVLGARWSEIDLNGKVWTIPADRMKAKREHRVPLSARVVELLGALSCGDSDDPFVFEGREGKPMSNMAMLTLLKRMKRDDLTTHGFRSTFRDWAAERTNFQNHVIEMALAHAVSDKVEAAYRRGELFEKRRRLMDAWAGFCESPAPQGDNIRQLRGQSLGA